MTPDMSNAELAEDLTAAAHIADKACHDLLANRLREAARRLCAPEWDDEAPVMKGNMHLFKTPVRVTGLPTAPAPSADERELAAMVNAQAEDDGLWFIAQTAPEAYLQQELRKLHAAVETFLAGYRKRPAQQGEEDEVELPTEENSTLIYKREGQFHCYTDAGKKMLEANIRASFAQELVAWCEKFNLSGNDVIYAKTVIAEIRRLASADQPR